MVCEYCLCNGYHRNGCPADPDIDQDTVDELREIEEDRRFDEEREERMIKKAGGF